MEVAIFIIVFLLFSHVLAFLIIRKYRSNYHKLRKEENKSGEEEKMEDADS